MNIREVEDKVTKQRKWQERNWGGYVVLHEQPGIKIKMLEVGANQVIPMQYHELHDEHWMVLSGHGEVRFGIMGDDVHDMKAGMIFDVPMGRWHEILGGSLTPLQFMEVQVAHIVPGTDANMRE